MESEPYEMSENYTPIDYQQFTHGSSQDEHHYFDNNFRVNSRTDEHRDQVRQSHDTKLYRNIIRKYGPEHPKEYLGHNSMKEYPEDHGYIQRERSPNRLAEPKKQNLEHHQAKFSFHPEINEMPKEIYTGAGKKLEISKEEQWDRLLKPKIEVIQERERMKYEKEAEEIQENCTFQPNINRNFEVTSTKNQNGKNIAVTDRLYAEGVEKLKMREMEKHRRNDDENAECTFKPEVSEYSKVLKGDRAVQKPLHERLGEIMKQKQEFLQKLRMDADINNKDMAFKPSLGEHTEILANAKQQIKDVTERLMKDAADKVHKKMKQIEEYEHQLTSTCTFQPNTHLALKSNDAILAGNDLYVMEKDVVTRQHLMADAQRDNLQKRAAEIIAKEGCTFVPKINQISRFLIEADPQRVNESEAERIERLSKKDAQKKEIFQEQMQKAHYDQYSFKPEINKISKDIGKKASLDELAYNRDAQEHLRILREKSIDNMLSECSFKPQLIHKKKYQTVEPLYKNEDQIMDNVKLVNKKKEIKYDQARKMAEYDEMKECTFKPKIKGDVAEETLKPKLIEKVAGLDKYMQMRDKHKKQQQDKKQREEEVFGIEKKYSAAKHEGFTTPMPFKLSQGSKKSIRDMKVAQELKEKMSREYTFKPATNEGKNREIINNMISYGNRIEYYA